MQVAEAVASTVVEAEGAAGGVKISRVPDT
jgi:hypothetical protein